MKDTGYNGKTIRGIREIIYNVPCCKIHKTKITKIATIAVEISLISLLLGYVTFIYNWEDFVWGPLSVIGIIGSVVFIPLLIASLVVDRYNNNKNTKDVIRFHKEFNNISKKIVQCQYEIDLLTRKDFVETNKENVVEIMDKDKTNFDKDYTLLNENSRLISELDTSLPKFLDRIIKSGSVTMSDKKVLKDIEKNILDLENSIRLQIAINFKSKNSKIVARKMFEFNKEEVKTLINI